MNLVPEKFKLIRKSYNGNEFMKIQYEDKDLVMKLKGEFRILETLRMIKQFLTKSMNWLVIKMNQKTILFLFP